MSLRCPRCSVIMSTAEQVEQHRCPSDVERERVASDVRDVIERARPDAAGDAAGRVAFEAFMSAPAPRERDAFEIYRDATRELRAAELEHEAAVQALTAKLAPVRARWRAALDALNAEILGT